jgi:hypothetical protein
VSERLYPKEKQYRDKSGRRWRVDYDLAYDGGGTSWKGYYRTRWGARVAAWWNYHFASWGGSAVLVEQQQPVPDDTNRA